MRIDVEMESLQRYFYYQMRQNQNLEINQGLGNKDWRLHDLIPLLPLSARESG